MADFVKPFCHIDNTYLLKINENCVTRYEVIILGKIARFRLQLWACPFLCVFDCLCVCYFLSHLSENQKCKKIVYRFWHLLSNGVIAKIVFRDLDLHFRFEMFKMWNSFVFVCYQKLKLWGKNQQYTFKHLRSNGVSIVLLICDFGLLCQGKKIIT